MKPVIISKVAYHKPEEMPHFQQFVTYCETRSGAREWRDRGLGSSYEDITERCTKLGGKKAISRNFTFAPDPEMWSHLPADQRYEILDAVVERTMRTWYRNNHFGEPEYSYIAHDKEEDDSEKLHAHVIAPGTIPRGRGRVGHYVRRVHVEDLNRTANAEFIREMERVLGRDRTREILQQRNARIALEKRQRWIEERGLPQREVPSKPQLDRAMLLRANAVLSLGKQQGAAKNQKQKQKQRETEIRRFAKQINSERNAKAKEDDLAAARARRAAARASLHEQRESRYQIELAEARKKQRGLIIPRALPSSTSTRERDIDER